MADDGVFASAWSRCIRRPRPPERRVERYVILATKDGRTLADIRWRGTARCSVLLPRAETIWGSSWLSEVGVWLRRLNRLGCPPGPTGP